MTTHTFSFVVLAVFLSGCIRPADNRSLLDAEVGQSSGGGLTVRVIDGQAQITSLRTGVVTLWAQAPTFSMQVTADATAPASYRVEVKNCLTNSTMTATSVGEPPRSVPRVDDGSDPTTCRWDVEFEQVSILERLVVVPTDADSTTEWSFAVMGDIQTALEEVHEIFDRINQDPDLSFVVSTGDLVENATMEEYELLLQQYDSLTIPYYSTIGNHELEASAKRWHDRFGRFNIHFEFRNTLFSFVDSGNATIDPIIYDQLDRWLDEGKDRVHIFGTHYPPLDPIGVRNAAFRSRKEAAKLLTRLARGNVDLTLYGHVHSFYAFENAGIPAYISGGGGATQEKWDGIGRHYLKVRVDPEMGIDSVAVVRID